MLCEKIAEAVPFVNRMSGDFRIVTHDVRGQKDQ